MGGSPSKSPEFKVDYSNAQFSAADIAAQAQKYAQTAAQSASESTGTSYKFWLYGVGIITVILGIILAYDAIAIAAGWPTLILPSPTKAPPSSPVDPSKTLYIDSAKYGPLNNQVDVTTYIQSMVTQAGGESLPSFTVGYVNVGLPTDPHPGVDDPLTVTYHVGGDTETSTATAEGGDQFPALPLAPKSDSATGPPSTDKGVQDAPPPPFLRKIYNSIFGDSSGELSPSFHDASSSTTIKANLAPLSAQRDGGYGMQWWMYVKDWNYGYGKKKSVLTRSDSTNRAVMNPDISLHPTDNSLQVSVSVYPSTEGGSGKAQPAPAGHSGSSDDVFVCDVANIPLQTWFSVSLTVFGRNMDIYIDGKLVKSCFLSGVPKPAAGDISLTPGGGFSGRVCGFYHYPKMLTPTDAMSFWAAGTPCRNQTASGGGSASGYNIKFGVYDALGKEVQEYAF
jgi:hypothetical protein